MLSIDEIWEDFRRNGRECDFSPIPDPSDRSSTYSPASPSSSCSRWPPDHIPSYGKSSPFNVTNAQVKLARALSALNLGGSRVPDQCSQRTQFCQHRRAKADLFGPSIDPMLSAEHATVLNALQGNSLIHNELVQLIHEKAQELSMSQEYRASTCHPDDSCLDMFWSNPCAEPCPMQAQRASSSPRVRSRNNVCERCDTCNISGRSSVVLRDIRFENRPSQATPRSGPRHSFNRTLNVKIPRDIDVDKYSTQYFPPTPSPSISSISSSSPSTPDPPSIPEETPVKDVPQEKTPRLLPNGSAVGRKRVASHSAPATPSPMTPAPGSTTPPATPPGPDSHHPKNAGAKPAAAPKDPGSPKGAATRTRGNQNRRRFTSESQLSSGCAFCKKNGESPSVYRGHIAKDAAGRTVCTILQKYVCPLCGATGEKAHTLKYCPNNLNPLPSPPERFRNSRGGNRQYKKMANVAK